MGVVVAILSVESLSVHFGVVRALDDVSFSLDEGKLLGLIGPNGAGKTTFIDAATGFASYTGHVVFGGRSLDKLGPHERVWCGMSRTFQSMELFEDLTVRENLRVSAENARRWAMFTRTDGRRGGGSLGLIDSTLEVLGLDDVSSELPSTLPLGVKKLIGVGRALSSGARLVLLDEPAAGLDTNESREFGRKLQQIRGQGITIVLVDHDMDLVFEVCEEVYVLNFGKLLAHGSVEDIKRNAAVRQAYLGEPVRNEDVEAAPA